MKTTLRILIALNLVLGLAVSWGFRELADQRHEGCVNRNNSTRVAVLIGAESLVAQSSDAPQDRVDAYLADLNERLDAAEIDC